MEVPAEIAKTIINEEIDQQIIVLREKGAEQRSFPVVIGMSEIFAIDRRMKGIALPRPLTHDLLEQVIDTFHWSGQVSGRECYEFCQAGASEFAAVSWESRRKAA